MSRATVGIPCWHSEGTIGACLAGLAVQTEPDVEVVVVNSSPGDRTAEIVTEAMPSARYIESPERLLPHAARNLAFTHSDAAILVSTDPDCVPDRQWLERLLAPLHEGCELTVGAMGTVGNGRRQMGIHLCKYATYLPGLDPGRRPIAPSANLAMSRRAWEAAGPFPADRFVGDAILSWRIAGRFGEARFVPDAVVCHYHDEEPAGFLDSRRTRGREFAEARVRHFGWPRLRAAAHLATLPILAIPPVVNGTRAAMRAGLGRSAISSLPLHFGGHVAWTLGEASAYREYLRRDRE